MASPATIIFTGITYLMLSNNPVEMRVAVVKEDTAKRNKHGAAVPRHVAFLITDGDMVDSKNSDRLPSYTFTKSGSTRKYNLYVLNQEVLTLSGVKTPEPLSIPTTATDSRLPFDAYVPSVSSFCPRCKLMTAEEMKMPNERIAATLLVSAGTLAVNKDAVDLNCIWEFPNEIFHHAPPPTPLSQEVTVDFDVDNFAINFASGNTVSSVKFLPPHDGHELRVTIGSAPMEDILVVPPVDHSDVDQHFDLYYSLLEGQKRTKHPLPRRGASCAHLDHRLGGANCPPVQQK